MIIRNKFLGAIFLIAGTIVGAGMLALPVSTGVFGIGPAACFLAICWVVMLCSALLMLEVNLWLPANTNLISMAKQTIGTHAAIIAWLAYLMLLYALLAAYVSGLSGVLTDSVLHITRHQLTSNVSTVLITALCAGLIYVGVQVVDLFNRVLIMGLFLTLVVLVVLLSPQVDLVQLQHADFHHSFRLLPLLFTTFGFQIIIPTLRTYLHGDVKHLRRAIWLGSSIPLLIYLFWEAIILGIIPVQGEMGLATLLQSSQPEVGLAQALAAKVGDGGIVAGFRSYAGFAIATSLLGVSLSLFDFLSDGLGVSKRQPIKRIGVLVLTFLPPFMFAISHSQGFIVALEYAGIFVAILLVILPAWMTWRGRYAPPEALAHRQKEHPPRYRMVGGKGVLVVLIIFALLVIGIELHNAWV